jgi:predicted nucleic acid-binding protein
VQVISGASSYQYLLDTNILIYPNDTKDPVKNTRATELLNLLQTEKNAALPAQALAEFANVALRKLIPPMDMSLIYLQIEGLTRDFPVLPLTKEIILEAFRGVRDYQFSYYDAQIWACAKFHKIPVILSEDFNSGAVIDGVTFLNPFDSGFDLRSLV